MDARIRPEDGWLQDVLYREMASRRGRLDPVP
jgi:hypothetical protein